MNLLIKVAHLKVAVPPFFAACVLASFLEPPVRPLPLACALSIYLLFFSDDISISIAMSVQLRRERERLAQFT